MGHPVNIEKIGWGVIYRQYSVIFMKYSFEHLVLADVYKTLNSEWVTQTQFPFFFLNELLSKMIKLERVSF